MLLLQHVAREVSRLRVLIVGSYRDTDLSRTHPLSEALAGFSRDPGLTRLVLRGLTGQEVATYIKATANVEPKRELIERIFEETEGNPFFLSEVVNLMAQEGTLAKDSVSDMRIPDGVREALGRRLDRVSEETNELLQVCAIVGREFTFDTLSLLGERNEDNLLRDIEEGLKAYVIEENGPARAIPVHPCAHAGDAARGGFDDATCTPPRPGGRGAGEALGRPRGRALARRLAGRRRGRSSFRPSSRT